MLSRARESGFPFRRKAWATASALGWVFCLNACTAVQAPLPNTPPPRGTLTLDASDPVTTVMIAGRPLRLIVDAAQWDSIELNPEAADRLPLTWEKGRELEVGRVTLAGRVATAILDADGRKRPVLVSSHGRSVTAEADGLIGPDLLPFGTVTWRWPGAPPPTGTMTMAMTLDQSIGLVTSDPGLALPIRIRFSFTRADSEATGAAGSFLAQRFGGNFVGAAQDVPVFLGVSRPARSLVFTRAPAIAGFRFPSLIVRVADFRGDNPLPADIAQSGDIVVRRREVPQPAQSWVTIGHDRLSRCAEVTYTAQPRSLSLSCAF